MSIIDALIGVLAPYDCLNCGVEGSLLCPGCDKSLSSSPAPRPSVELTALSDLHSTTRYGGLAKDLTWQLKTSGAQAAATIMAKRMVTHLDTEVDLLIVPVPTATGRIRQRGYDQAKLLAKSISLQTGLLYIDCLARRGQTHQVGADRHLRHTQLQAAFRVKKATHLRDMHLVLIDDVTTTGATLEMAARALIAAGAAQVSAITFAQA